MQGCKLHVFQWIFTGGRRGCPELRGTRALSYGHLVFVHDTVPSLVQRVRVRHLNKGKKEDEEKRGEKLQKKEGKSKQKRILLESVRCE